MPRMMRDLIAHAISETDGLSVVGEASSAGDLSGFEGAVDVLVMSDVDPAKRVLEEELAARHPSIAIVTMEKDGRCVRYLNGALESTLSDPSIGGLMALLRESRGPAT